MKKAIVLTAVLAVMASGSLGQAANKKKVIVAVNDNVTNVTITDEAGPAKKKIKKKAAQTQPKKTVTRKVITPVESKPAVAAQPAPSVIQPSAAPVARPVSPAASRADVGTVRTTITKVAPKAAKSNFAFKYSSENALDMAAIQNNPGADTEVKATDNLGLSYKFTDTFSGTVQAEFYHTWFGNRDRLADGNAQYSSSGAGYMGPVKLILANSKIAQLKGGLTLDGFVRYDLPTSEASQKDGELGQTRLNVGLGRSFGKFDAKISFMGRYYIQQFNTSEITKDDLRKQNKQVRFYETLDLGYNFTDKFALTLSTGFYQTVFHDDPDTDRSGFRRDVMTVNPEMSYAFNENFSLAAGVYEDTNMAAIPVTGYVPFEVLPDGGGRDYLYSYLTATIKF
ncbi:MAG: transporter [Oligoflexia bacterium]|nr:transporter [Oligoflexia bacterium]